ncbi:hypothetical protein [Bernardetia sp. MNP-M8]|uniref:hypothetical protein n=1 Tax=Bernardetia sp. MNP-M8 TaxID=3127470 RepID=UPI0030D48B2D
MKLETIISKISQLEEIQTNPPILVDVGASGALIPQWKNIAHFSICIAFDADDREFEFIQKESNDFKKLFIFNRIVTDKLKKGQDEATFYLTKNPYCSSLLEPFDSKGEKMESYYYADYFEVEKQINLKAITLNDALKQVKVPQIDWFKTDSQGIDLRLFTSLSKELQDKTIVAEFEPGFIDVYKGEDTIIDVLQELKQNPLFFLTEFDVKRVVQLPQYTFQRLYPTKIKQDAALNALRTIPAWSEMTYMNNLKKDKLPTKRDFVLAWLFSTIQNHHDLAYNYASQAKEVLSKEILDDSFFDVLQNYSYDELENILASSKGAFQHFKYTVKKFLKG